MYFLGSKSTGGGQILARICATPSAAVRDGSTSRVGRRDPSSVLAANHGGGPHSRRKNGPHNLLLKQVVMGRGREGRFRGSFRRSHSIRLKPNTMGRGKWLSLAGGGGHRRPTVPSAAAAGVIGGGIRPRPRPPVQRPTHTHSHARALRRRNASRIFPRPQRGRHARARTARRGVSFVRGAKIGDFAVWLSAVFVQILGGGGWAFGKSRRNGAGGVGREKREGHGGGTPYYIYMRPRIYARRRAHAREGSV